jgi:hypothetical protein
MLSLSWYLSLRLILPPSLHLVEILGVIKCEQRHMCDQLIRTHSSEQCHGWPLHSTPRQSPVRPVSWIRRQTCVSRVQLEYTTAVHGGAEPCFLAMLLTCSPE